ncbi:oxidoreductase [Sphingobium yanoikuyae]|uniref:oxidoreductase n=1 Tax=Sphingobium yanoikuyae TaxID=13690 RepID=UPI0022DDD7AB|nr:oxidoreductase [Sphingobium yanoikuyae]WBQ15708.1 oxidoreductase [Sphingobium yanoikuyae]
MSEGAGGRTLLITGVGSGLGAAFARAALAAGHQVVGTVRSEAGAAAFTAATGAPALVLDLTDVDAMPGTVAQAEALAGPIDILINNAGFGHEGSLEESPLDALRRQLDVNVVGPVALMQAVLPGMRARQRGHIVNVTSMAGSTGLTGVSFYCGAKFALEGISEALGKEVRPLGIMVTAFAPGQFRTDWAGRSLERSPRTIADYDPIMDPQRAFRLARSGKQPGDPDKAAALLMRLIATPNPPARLLAGPDALALASQKLKRVQAEISAWEEAGRATDF